MADFSVVAAGVVKRTGATPVNGVAGETLAPGKAVYLNANDSRWWLAQSDGTAAQAGSGGIGVALHTALAGQPIQVITAGDWYAGAAAVEGEDYYCSDTAGGLAPRADTVTSTEYRTLICTGLDGGDMRMIGSYTGAQIP